MLLRRRANVEPPSALKALDVTGTPGVHEPPGLIDAETGLGNERMLQEILRREIARSQRYGDRSALCVFDVETVMGPERAGETPPSPARFVAAVLQDAAREADVIFRAGPRHFVALLTESDDAGARSFCERVRTRISSAPYARLPDGTGCYARGWAGGAACRPDVTTPAEYLEAAVAVLEATRPGYDVEASWFSGTRKWD